MTEFNSTPLIDVKETLVECINIIQNESIADKEEIILIRLESILSYYDDYQEPANFELNECVNKCIEVILEVIQAKDSAIMTNLGRPKFEIRKNQIEELLFMKFKVKEIAKMFGVHFNTILSRMNEYGLSVRDSYTNISDEGLSSTIHTYLVNFPNTGYRRMKGYLFASGIKVTENRIREMMRKVDPEGVYQRRQRKDRTIKRREYFVKYSNQMWHIDANIKLRRWGIVIRAGIDGKSRTLTYLAASNDNRADTHLKLFLEGVQEYGIPYRVRTDKGGENVLIAKFMLENRGLGRRSHICGRSVHNQRIERFWRDLSEGCTTFYKNVFNKLEFEGALNIDEPLHLDTLHKVFLPRLNQHLAIFRNGWNLHPISTENDKSPLQLMLMYLPPPEYDLEIPTNDLDNLYFSCDDFDDLTQFDSREETIPNPIPISNDLILDFDPLAPSTDFGCDIYKYVLSQR